MDLSNNEITRNLVISGGSIVGFLFYGALKEMHKREYWKYEELNKIYCTSAGSMVTLLLLLHYDWEDIDKFIIERPWHKVFRFDLTKVFNSIENVGMYDLQLIHDSFDSLLLGKGLEPNTTMKELYEFSNIETHIITTDINNMKTIDISHLTHPDFPVIDAIYCSCALPIVFKPYEYEETFLCDGGLTCNFPLELCLKENKNEETITIGLDEKFVKYSKNDNLFTYLNMLSLNLLKSINVQKRPDNLKMQVHFDPDIINLENSINVIIEQESRKKLIDMGVEKVKSTL